MNKISGLKALASQSFSTTDPDNGYVIKMTLTFRSRVQSWFMDLEYKGLEINGFRLCVGPNILSQFKNRIPFGMAIFSSDNGEPFLINDFYTGRISMYILSSSEVETVQTAIDTGVWS